MPRMAGEIQAEVHDRIGIARIHRPEKLNALNLKVCHELAARSPLALRLAKEGVLRAVETSLSDGLEYERKLFYMLFATEDQKEGMRAFMEKRSAVFVGR